MRITRRSIRVEEVLSREEPITDEGLLRVADDRLVQAGYTYAIEQLKTKLFLNKLRQCFDSLHERWDGGRNTFMADLHHVVNKYVSEHTDISYQRFRSTPSDIERLRRNYFLTVLHMCRIVAAKTAEDRAEIRQPSLSLEAAE